MRAQPQPYKVQRGQSQPDQIDVSYPTGKEDEELDISVRRYPAHDAPWSS